MTLPPTSIGDRGQRYLIETWRWPKDSAGWQAAGYCTKKEDADRLRSLFLECPGCEGARVIDRNPIDRPLDV